MLSSVAVPTSIADTLLEISTYMAMALENINYVMSYMAGKSAGPTEDTSVLCGSHQNFITF